MWPLSCCLYYLILKSHVRAFEKLWFMGLRLTLRTTHGLECKIINFFKILSVQIFVANTYYKSYCVCLFTNNKSFIVSLINFNLYSWVEFCQWRIFYSIVKPVFLRHTNWFLIVEYTVRSPFRILVHLVNNNFSIYIK